MAVKRFVERWFRAPVGLCASRCACIGASALSLRRSDDSPAGHPKTTSLIRFTHDRYPPDASFPQDQTGRAA